MLGCHGGSWIGGKMCDSYSFFNFLASESSGGQVVGASESAPSHGHRSIEDVGSPWVALEARRAVVSAGL